MIYFTVRIILLLFCILSYKPSIVQAEQPDIPYYSVNLNDGEYAYGYLDADGTECDPASYVGMTFRNKNYLPVKGGSTISCYYDAAEWNNYNKGIAATVVQYDKHKNVVVPTVALIPYAANQDGLILHKDTAYIRLCYNKYTAVISTPLDEIKLAVYYLSDYSAEYLPPTPFSSPNASAFSDPLFGKLIIYDGDSITESRREANGGGYPQLIAQHTKSYYTNLASGGAHLTSTSDSHSVVDNLIFLPKDGDLYCFSGGINDYWANVPIGIITSGYSDAVNTQTLCGALEHIFRYSLNQFSGKPICFIINHKVRKTAFTKNANGNTFQDFHDAIVQVCNKYSIPYYDAFLYSGLNGWNENQMNTFFVNSDGIHPNKEGYQRYYVPQLLSLFRSLLHE